MAVGALGNQKAEHCWGRVDLDHCLRTGQVVRIPYDKQRPQGTTLGLPLRFSWNQYF